MRKNSAFWYGLDRCSRLSAAYFWEPAHEHEEKKEMYNQGGMEGEIQKRKQVVFVVSKIVALIKWGLRKRRYSE